MVSGDGLGSQGRVSAAGFGGERRIAGPKRDLGPRTRALRPGRDGGGGGMGRKMPTAVCSVGGISLRGGFALLCSPADLGLAPRPGRGWGHAQLPSPHHERLLEKTPLPAGSGVSLPGRDGLCPHGSLSQPPPALGRGMAGGPGCASVCPSPSTRPGARQGLVMAVSWTPGGSGHSPQPALGRRGIPPQRSSTRLRWGLGVPPGRPFPSSRHPLQGTPSFPMGRRGSRRAERIPAGSTGHCHRGSLGSAKPRGHVGVPVPVRPWRRASSTGSGTERDTGSCPAQPCRGRLRFPGQEAGPASKGCRWRAATLGPPGSPPRRGGNTVPLRSGAPTLPAPRTEPGLQSERTGPLRRPPQPRRGGPGRAGTRGPTGRGAGGGPGRRGVLGWPHGAAGSGTGSRCRSLGLGGLGGPRARGEVSEHEGDPEPRQWPVPSAPPVPAMSPACSQPQNIWGTQVPPPLTRRCRRPLGLDVLVPGAAALGKTPPW